MLVRVCISFFCSYRFRPFARYGPSLAVAVCALICICYCFHNCMNLIRLRSAGIGKRVALLGIKTNLYGRLGARNKGDKYTCICIISFVSRKWPVAADRSMIYDCYISVTAIIARCSSSGIIFCSKCCGHQRLTINNKKIK